MQLSYDKIINFWQTNIAYLKGVGPKKAKLLQKHLNVHTFWDIILLFPRRYKNRKLGDVNEIYSYAMAQKEVGFVGKILKLKKTPKYWESQLVIRNSNRAIRLMWFKLPNFILDKINDNKNKNFFVVGKITYFNKNFTITHPELYVLNANSDVNKYLGIFPVYHSNQKLTSAGISSKTISNIISNLFSPNNEPYFFEIIPEGILEEFDILPWKEALYKIHFPKNPEEHTKALERFKFEEIFLLQILLQRRKKIIKSKHKAYPCEIVGEKFYEFYEKYLPFELTNAQKRVIKEIRRDMKKSEPMSRLLQGDVGSGKTMVALLASLIAIDNGLQVAIMAPTEILAEQHYKKFTELLWQLGINIKLLTGSVKQKQKKEIKNLLKLGAVNIVIGTHALIQDNVEFKKLGLVVIDEQHKFGVLQRSMLERKGEGVKPHTLYMTATPIPRTLALNFYGDLDVSIINEMPPGRKPVKTFVRTEAFRLRVYGFIREELKKGGQVYVVYPLIEESEKLDLKSAIQGYEDMRNFFKEFKVGLVHGKMKPAEKEQIMQQFKENKIQILVSTTVIEVGVDVPNANIIVIEEAHRFGLSQLHQLRGRVGRGDKQAYAILMVPNKIGDEAKQRLQSMEKITDGFKLAEIDLQIRGPGDFLGTKQSGLPEFKYVDFVADRIIFEKARDAATKIIEDEEVIEKHPYLGKFIADYVKKYNLEHLTP